MKRASYASSQIGCETVVKASYRQVGVEGRIGCSRRIAGNPASHHKVNIKDLCIPRHNHIVYFWKNNGLEGRVEL